MKVMIAYASIEGQTRKISRFLEDTLKKAGHDVQAVEVSDEGPALSFNGVDHVILAASVHERRHPKAFEVLLAGQGDKLADKKTLLISVSLKAAFEDGQEEAQDYLDEMKLRTGFEPDREILVAGAVRSGSYDYFQTQVVRHVLLRGQSYDPADGEREFTDYGKLAASVDEFLKVDA